jgi:hypothetical protein
MVTTPRRLEAQAGSERSGAGGRSFWYSLFGRLVQSEIALPLAESAQLGDRAPDWHFRRMPDRRQVSDADGPVVAAVPCIHEQIVTVLREGASGTWLWNLGMATCHIPPGSTAVDV